MQSNIYIQLTDEFNVGRLRAIICSGQAAVLHRVAIMSKDGDWILREEDETCRHVLAVLDRHGARYRFGAPLDVRWLAGGWSSHFEFTAGPLRVRTDFFTRPPRLDEAERAALWSEQQHRRPPFIGLTQLCRMKQTDREKDYVVIGELARRMTDPADQLRYSRSAVDLIRLAARYPDLAAAQARERPVLAVIAEGRDRLEAALDAERRDLMRANERRLARFDADAVAWKAHWPEVRERIAPMPLREAHAALVEAAAQWLPCS